MSPEAFHKAVAIRQRAEEIRQAIKRLDEERYKAVIDLNNQLAELQSRCPHSVTTHYPDAAGGNTSFDRCELCGHEG